MHLRVSNDIVLRERRFVNGQCARVGRGGGRDRRGDVRGGRCRGRGAAATARGVVEGGSCRGRCSMICWWSCGGVVGGCTCSGGTANISWRWGRRSSGARVWTC